jgi:hypothetical protein
VFFDGRHKPCPNPLIGDDRLTWILHEKSRKAGRKELETE